MSEGATATQPKVTKLLELGVDENERIYVNWPYDKQKLCVIALAEAMKMVATYDVPKEKNAGHKLVDFIRGKK